MDESIIGTRQNKYTPTTVYFIWFVAVSAVFITLGIKCRDKIPIPDGLSFYGRYDGIGSYALSHIKAAAVCASSTLMQILSLYVLSYSSLLVPASIAIIAYRGFAAGTAYTMLGCTNDAVQLIWYVAITAAVCLMGALFIRCNKESKPALKKTAILFMTAGFSTLAEFVLSYII